jgi:hypothetical protein
MIDASVTNVSADERNDAVIQHKNQSDSKEFVNRGEFVQ